MNKSVTKQYPKRERKQKVTAEDINTVVVNDDSRETHNDNDSDNEVTQNESLQYDEGEEDDDENGVGDENDEEDNVLEEYFEVHSRNKDFATSDKTLSKLSNPKMNQEELRKNLKEVQQSHIEEIIKLRSENYKNFDKWMFQMLCGFNILVYGLGSKRMLLDIFRKYFLIESYHLVINGLFPNHTAKSILNMITSDMLDTTTTFKSVMDQSTYIKKAFNEKSERRLFIIIYNIDGVVLRTKKLQSVLAHIGSASNIHLLASIDHINAPLIWDQSNLNSLTWLWYDTTTFEPYTEETLYGNSVMVESTGGLARSSLEHVMRSLTSNAKGIFKLLGEYHIENGNNNNYVGMPFTSLYSHCRETFLVNSDTNLRAQLTEFKDHKLIKFKKGNDGTENVAVLVDMATLRNFFADE